MKSQLYLPFLCFVIGLSLSLLVVFEFGLVPPNGDDRRPHHGGSLAGQRRDGKSSSVKLEPSGRRNMLIEKFDIMGPSPDPLPPLKGSEDEQEEASRQRKLSGVPYGRDAAADPIHIGGFLDNDTNSYEPLAWEWMMNALGVRSVLDVGCGRGYSSKYFVDHGLRVLCVEGSHAGVRDSLLPKSSIVQHDFQRGPWWPNEYFDAVWSVEVLEHIPAKNLLNIFATFSRARYLFVSHSIWGGFSHASVHENWWWIEQLEAVGFKYLPVATKSIRDIITIHGGGPRTNSYFRLQGLVFRNENFEAISGQPLAIPTPHNCTALIHSFCRNEQRKDGKEISQRP